jgi:D-glycero-alpha-D-manno-heptose-7-phosphate kinase
MTYTARAPVRIDFAGAWTDVPVFADAFGGATLNAAIAIHVTGRLEVGDVPAGTFDTVQRAVSGPSGKYAVGNTPLLSVNCGSIIPAGTGLGTSATMGVVWLSLLRREEVNSVADRMRIAGMAYEMEQAVGIVGGMQDQYASAVGGINLFEFGRNRVQRHPVCLTPDQITELETLLLLCYTGTPRLSSSIHEQVWRRFRAGDNDTIRALLSLRDSAHEAQQALTAWDLEAFSNIVAAQRGYMQRLDTSTSSEQVDRVLELAEPYVRCGKPSGAGGGGCVFFIARDAEAQQRLRAALQTQGFGCTDVEIDFSGLTVSRR